MVTNDRPDSGLEVVQPDLAALRLGISSTFSLDEIKLASFDLGIDYENLEGGTKDIKIVSMIEYARRHGMMQELVAYVQNARPNLKLQQKALAVTSSPVSAEERARHRRALREAHKDIYLVHTLRPSPGREGWYDILIYLVAHKQAKLAEVSYAEFFLGGAWNYRIFRADNQEGFIGISISAYGPVLCTCRVVFNNQEATLMERYIDFEMTSLFERASKRAGVQR